MKKVMLSIVSLLFLIYPINAQLKTVALSGNDFDIATSYDNTDTTKQTAFILFAPQQNITAYGVYFYEGQQGLTTVADKSMAYVKNKEDLAVILNAKNNNQKIYFLIKGGSSPHHFSNVGWVTWEIVGMQVKNNL